jgi:hypothetical protein
MCINVKDRVKQEILFLTKKMNKINYVYLIEFFIQIWVSFGSGPKNMGLGLDLLNIWVFGFGFGSRVWTQSQTQTQRRTETEA